MKRFALVAAGCMLFAVGFGLAFVNNGRYYNDGYKQGLEEGLEKSSTALSSPYVDLQPVEKSMKRVPPSGQYGYIDPRDMLFGERERTWGFNPLDSFFSQNSNDPYIMRVGNIDGMLIAEVPPFCYDGSVGSFKKVKDLPDWYAQVEFTGFTCGLG